MDTTPGSGLLSPIRHHLEAMRNQVYRDLRDYPQPVAGCDEQYRHLSERRNEISRDLVRLAAVERGHAADRDDRNAVEAFLGQSQCIDEATAQRLRQASKR